MPNPYLPPEILDYFVDLLHHDPTALKQCCLASKSWILRTRKHLFAVVKLPTEEHLETWKKTFPDLSTSPACFAKSLHIGCARAVTAADAESGRWLTGFVHIVHLGVGTQERYPGQSIISLVPFRGFAPTIKSLTLNSVALPPSQIFDFILSSPLLEDLAVAGYGTSVDDGLGSDGPSITVQSSNPPPFTGTLELPLEGGMEPIAGRLLSMPGGIHFRKLTVKCYHKEDILLTTALVNECSHTLESLEVACNSCGTSTRYLRPRQYLTAVFSRLGVNFGRPLEGDGAQGSHFSGHFVTSQMGYPSPPSHLARPSRSSANLDFSGLLLNQYHVWCRRHANYWGTNAWAVV